MRLLPASSGSCVCVTRKLRVLSLTFGVVDQELASSISKSNLALFKDSDSLCLVQIVLEKHKLYCSNFFQPKERVRISELVRDS